VRRHSEKTERRGGSRVTEIKDAKLLQQTPRRCPSSTFWLVVKHEKRQMEVLMVACSGEQALPVFSSEREAEMFLWLEGAFEQDWRVREISAGELVSILYGPCAGVGRVALDPSPEMAAETLGLVSVSRERFVNWIVDSPCFDSPGARHHACGLVRLL
jgi:hypothetical protein